MDPLQVVLQFLKEEGYHESFDTLLREAEASYTGENFRPHILRQNLGEMNISDQTSTLRRILQGSTKLKGANEDKKITFNCSPVAMVSLDDSIVASFNNGTVRKLDATTYSELLCVSPNLSTIICFERNNDLIYFGTMAGPVGALNATDLSVVKSSKLLNGNIIALTVFNGFLFAASRNNQVAILDTETFSVVKTLNYSNPVTALCQLNNGIILSVQNDPMFHFLSGQLEEEEILYHMSPNVFEVGALDIRDMRQCPTDESLFVALTDRCKAYLYHLAPNGKNLDVWKVVTHFVSDGLTQPQLLWTYPSTMIATSDDQTVVAIDVESDSVVFQLNGWDKATRCVAIVGDTLFVGAFDKSITMFHLTKV